MTIQEFDAGGKDQQPCYVCGARGMVREHNLDNNGERVVCPTCHSRSPWPKQLFLKHSAKTNRKEYPHGESLNEVWERFGDRCVVCSRTADELAMLGVGRNRQHVAEYAESQHQGPLVPICARCHQIANALQRDAAVMRGFIHFSINNGERPAASRPALSPSGVSPYPVRAAGKAATGRVERFPDDDADD